MDAPLDTTTDTVSDDGIVLTDEFARALTILESGEDLFLTGKAGTGKSTLIRHFIAGSERRMVVAAPTGIAALNVSGYTIHRLFSFQTTTTLEEVRNGSYRPQRFFKTLKSLETLIIDEASMVRADLFDMLAAALERFGPKPGTPFGGVQVVLVGDLLQLPPVVTTGESDYFSTRYPTPYFFSAGSFRREDFPTVALTTVFRQLGDQRLTSILNAVREGVLLENARQELNSRTVPDFVPPEDEFWLTLAPTNSIVTSRNRRQLERLLGEELVHHARQSGDLSLFDPPVEEKLSFKVGAQIMMLTNDSGERWVNGTLRRIADVANDADGVVAKVEFRDGTIAEVQAHTRGATVDQQPSARAVGEPESSDVHGLATIGLIMVRADDVPEAQVQPKRRSARRRAASQWIPRACRKPPGGLYVGSGGSEQPPSHVLRATFADTGVPVWTHWMSSVTPALRRLSGRSLMWRVCMATPGPRQIGVGGCGS